MERFVQLALAGGIALVAGLWMAANFAWGTPGWAGGIALTLLGGAGLATGIWSELDV